MSSQASFEAAYGALALKAWHTNSARLAELQQLAEESRRTGTWTPERWERCTELAHSIRGSAGTFGQEAVSLAAEELETTLQASGPTAVRSDVVALISRIAEAIGRAPESPEDRSGGGE